MNEPVIKVNPNSANVILAKKEKDTRWWWAVVLVVVLFVGRGVIRWNRAQGERPPAAPPTHNIPSDEELQEALRRIQNSDPQPAEEPAAESTAPAE